MSHQLRAPATSGSEQDVRRSSWLAVVAQALAVVGIFAIAGVLAGLLWFQLWSPVSGVVSDGQWLTDEDGLRAAFSGTGLYVIVAVVGGFLVGALTSFLFDRSELVMLVATLVGAALAGWVMLRLGLEWSPADPEVLARAARDGAELRSALVVDLPHPWLAFPGGALVAMAVVFLTTTRRDDER